MNRRPPKPVDSAPNCVNRSSIDRFQRVGTYTGSSQIIVGAHERPSGMEQRSAEHRNQTVPASLRSPSERLKNSPALIYTTCNDSNSQLFQDSLREEAPSPPRHISVPQTRATRESSDPLSRLPQKYATYSEAEKHRDPPPYKQSDLALFIETFESDVHEDRSLAHVKPHATQSQQLKQFESQQSPEIYRTERTSPCSTCTTKSLRNATKSEKFASGKRSTMRYKSASRLPATNIKDGRSTEKSGTLKRRLLQSQIEEMNNDDLQPADTEEEQSGEDVEETNTKSVLRPKKSPRKSTSKVLVQTSFLNAHNELKLQLEAERRKSSLLEASGSPWRSECERLKSKLKEALVSI